MITIAKEVEKNKVLTIKDLNCGDTFVILSSGWDGVFLMTFDDTFVELSTGMTYYAEDNGGLPVRKIDFMLVEK